LGHDRQIAVIKPLRTRRESAASAVGDTSRRFGRGFAIAVSATAALIPLAGLAIAVWARTDADLAAVRTERHGTQQLGAVVKLVVAVADAQSAAVHGTPGDPSALVAAVAAVDHSGLAQNPGPDTATLWAQVRAQVLALSGSPSATGVAAYQNHSQVTDLLLQQIITIDDASGLDQDPGADTTRLVDALTVRLPDMAVQVGRLDDLTATAGGRGAGGQNAAAARIAIVRDRIAVDAHGFGTELDKVFRATTSATLGPHLLGDVDLVTTDVDALAPTASVTDQTLAIPSQDTVTANRQAFDPAALVLETAGLTELDRLLDARRSGYQQRKLDLALLVVAAAASAAPAVFWLIRSTRTPEVPTGIRDRQPHLPRQTRQPRRERSPDGRHTHKKARGDGKERIDPGTAAPADRWDP